MEDKYAEVFTRIKAAFVDTIVLVILMYIASEVFNAFEMVPDYTRITVYVVLFFLYEPILVSFFGATVGHFFNDIVVKRINNEEKNILFPMAVFRFLTKAFLGWISLLSVRGNEKRQAIHDYAGGSIVLKYTLKKKAV